MRHVHTTTNGHSSSNGDADLSSKNGVHKVKEDESSTDASGRTLKGVCSASLIVRRSPQPKALPADLSALRFGAQFTQHMLQIQWNRAHGWGAPLISPLEPLPMHPAAQVLHYGMSCFEGMKAYKRARDGAILMFRPDRNMQRFAMSCRRLNLPDFDQEEMLECLKQLLREERDWIPDRDGYSIYLRPAMAASTPFLGVGPPSDALMWCVLSPVGPYFPSGLKPVSLLVDTQHARAYPGGMGDRKAAGNYAPTILPQVLASHHGCSQVLYVLKSRNGNASGSVARGKGGGQGDDDDDPDTEDGLVGESGSMNVFFLMRKKDSAVAAAAQEGLSAAPQWASTDLELVTPPLDGLILPGVTRDSVLSLARSWGGIQVSERPVWLRELKEAHEEGRLLEVFGTGTAVIVQPVRALVLRNGRELAVPVDDDATAYWTGRTPGVAHRPPAPDAPFSLAGRLYRGLLDVQYGHVEHEGWSLVV